MSHCSRPFLGFLLVVFLVISSAYSRSLEISEFHCDIQVLEKGQVIVTERIAFEFTGAWNGIFRLIPVRYRTPRDSDFHLDLTVMSVTDGAGNELNYESSRENHYRKVKVWVPDAVDTTRVVEIRYRVGNALQFFEEYDELYWNVTGDEWELPIRHAVAQIHLPEGVSGIRTVAYTGPYGSRESAATISQQVNTIRFETTRELNIHEGLTVAVAWDPGVVERPTALEKGLSFFFSLWPLLIPAAVFLLMFSLWKRRGKDPESLPVVPRYEPPEGMTPAEIGTLLDHRPDMRDITATLIDLAVRGHLEIEETKEEKLLGLWSDTSYAFIRKTGPQEWVVLHPYERQFLDELFKGGIRDHVKLEDLKNRFYKKLPDLHQAIFDRLLSQHYYRSRPDKVRRFYLTLAAVSAVVGFWILFAFEFVQPSLFPNFTAVILTPVIVGGFGWVMPARTRIGTRKLAEILGFQEFLDRVESDRFKTMITGPEMFEKYLPYAMALGVEESWARAFQDIFTEPPDWYHGTSMPHFRSSVLVSRLGQMSTQAGTVLASAPRSRGGSSFGGGGGSSGGGGGGGGGGGF